MRPLGAQISHALKARGVDVVFGIPGVHNVEMYRGIEEAGITHVLARHEQGAGFMADGYARASGKPGIAYVITGPGLCNIMTPMGQAFSDSVPLFVISSCLERGDLLSGKGRLHEMRDQEAAAETVCAWSRTAMDAGAAYRLIDRAFAEFATARSRAVHMQVPIDALSEPAPPAPAMALPANPPVAAAADIARAVEMLNGADRVLLVLGGGAVGAADALRAFVARAGVAVFPTYAARGIVPDDDDRSFGAYLARPESVDVIASADLVIAIGCEFSETDFWRADLGHRSPLIRVDIDPTALATGPAAALAIQGDAANFVAALDLATSNMSPKTGWEDTDFAAQRAIFRASTDAARPGIADVAEAISAALPAGTMFYTDMTQLAYVGKEVCVMDRPGHWHHPFGFGTLGYALPAAIGGKVAVGDAPVVAIAGDYGFHYTMQELGVAVELGLSLPIILWDNGKLMEIEASMVRSQIAPNAVVARNPDFCKLAEAFGARAVAPGDLTSLKRELDIALTAGRPTLVYVTPDIAGPPGRE